MKAEKDLLNRYFATIDECEEKRAAKTATNEDEDRWAAETDEIWEQLTPLEQHFAREYVRRKSLC